MSFVKFMAIPMRRQKSGFTLIEVMIVLLVVGILIGVTFVGASYLFIAQQEKKALADIGAIKLALEEFKIEFGDYPRTDVNLSNPDDEVLCGRRLFQALSGYVDKKGILYEDPSLRPKSFLKSDALNLAEQTGRSMRKVILDLTDFESGTIPEYVAIDSWDTPYVYEHPRRDGNLGYLLFSKGPDQETSKFTTEQASPPERQDFDYDNLPANEPGKW